MAAVLLAVPSRGQGFSASKAPPPAGGARPHEHLAPLAPLLDPYPALTNAGSVQLSGVAPSASEMRVQAPSGLQVVPVHSGAFSVNVPLVPDRVNAIALLSIGFGGATSSPTMAYVTQDSTPPEVFIDEPLDGAEVTLDEIDVFGRVADGLSGVTGLTVTVNGVGASVASGPGPLATFRAAGVALDPPPTPTILTATAQDAAGNVSQAQVTVTQVAIPPGSSTVSILPGGDGQTGVVRTELTQPIEIEVRRHDGSPYVGKLVTFDVVKSDGQLSAVSGGTLEWPRLQVLTGTDGRARAWWRLGSDAGTGNNRVKVTAKDSLGTVGFSASAVAGPATKVNIASGNNQVIEAGTQSLLPLEVWVNDDQNGVAGVDVTFSVVLGDGLVNGQAQAVVTSDAGGRAEASLRLGPSAGFNVVEATFGSPAQPPVVFVARGVERENIPTRLSGLVLDDSAQPLEGVTCTLSIDGVPVGLSSTDLLGRFAFEGLSGAGLAEIEVNGSTAVSVGGPGGLPVLPGSYPNVSLETVLVPDADNRLPAPVFLPPLRAANTVAVGDISTQGALLEIAGLEGLLLTVEAGSLLDPTTGLPVVGPVTFLANQVHHDRSPWPLPDGTATPLAWSLIVQGAPDGAYFYPPIDVRLPNVSTLNAGALAYYQSFQPSGNQLAVAASGTVSASASTIKPEPGSGIKAIGDSPEGGADAAAKAFTPGGLGLGSLSPPFAPTYALEIPSPCKLSAGDIPPTSLLPVANGTIRDDTCGSGAFGAPRGIDVNHGVDIVGNVGDPIVVVYDGRVVAVQSGCFPDPFCSQASRDCGSGYGNFVVVEHTVSAPSLSLFYTAYTQLETALVAVGDTLLAGDTIGTLGQSGNANPICFSGCTITPYVHFEISAIEPPLAGDRPRCNPQDYLVSLPPPSGSTPPAPEFSPFQGWLVYHALGKAGYSTDDLLVHFDELPFLPSALGAIRATWIVGDTVLEYRSPWVDAVTNQTLRVIDLDPDPDGPPVELRATVADPVLTAPGQQTQLTVTAFDQGGTSRDVTPRAAGTVYATSNPDIVTVDLNGLVTAVGTGDAYLTATNDGVTSTVGLFVDLGDPKTTVVGFVVDTADQPVVGAEITVFPGNLTGTTQPAGPSVSAGSFSIANVPAFEGPITVIVDATVGGQELTATVTGIPVAPGGLTDAGIIKLETTVSWDFDGSGNWTDPTKWSTGAVPQPGDNVVIDRDSGSYTITLGSATALPKSLRCKEALVLGGGGVLEVATPCQLDGPLTIQGGRLRSTHILQGSAGLVTTPNAGWLESITLDGPMSMPAGTAAYVDGGLVLNDTLTMSGADLGFYAAPRTLSGTGQVVTASSTNSIRAADASSALTIASTMTVRVTGGLGYVGVAGTGLDNQGLLRAEAGQLVVRGNWTNQGTIEALSGSTLETQDGWSNTGTISATSATVWFGGSYTLTGLGTFVNNASSVRINGVFDLSGGSLDFSTTTGSWLLWGGRIRNGTITATGGAGLVTTPNAGWLESITLDGPMTMPAGTAAYVDGGLVLNDTLTMSGADLGFYAAPRTLSGTGQVVTASSTNSIRAADASSALTIASTMTVRVTGGLGYVGVAGTGLDNQGLLRAEAGQLVVRGNWTNQGTIEALSGSTLETQDGWSNTGTISATSATVWFGGSYTLTGLGTFVNNASSVRINGVFDLSGGSLDFSTTTGSWLLWGGRIRNGTITATGGAGLVTTPNAGWLESITLDGPMTMPAGTAAYVDGGLVLNDTLTMSGADLGFYAAPRTLSGTGQVVTASSTNSIRAADASSALTIASTMTVRVTGGLGFVGVVGNGLDNQGLLRAEAGQLVVRGNWTNQGTIEALSGSTLETQDGWSNTGTISATSATVWFGGSYTLTGLGTFVNNASSVRINGVFDLSGGSLDFSTTTGSWLLWGGRIRNGTITATGGAGLVTTGNAGWLESITLDGPMTMPAGTAAYVEGGLVLNDTLTMDGADLGFYAAPRTLSGTGQVVTASSTNSIRAADASSALTIASTMTVRVTGGLGFVGVAGTGLDNQGLLRAEAGQLVVRGNWTNQGTIEALPGSTLETQDGWSNTGTISATSATVWFGGSYTLTGLGTFVNNASSVRITGVFDLGGGSLDFSTTTGSWLLWGGRIRNGTITATGGAGLVTTGNAGWLESITLDGPMTMPAGTAAYVEGGLVLNETLTMDGADLGFYAAPRTLSGTGQVVAASSNNSIRAADASSALTIASTMTVRVTGGLGFVGVVGNGLDNQGLLRAEAGQLVVRGNWTNQGTIEALSGATVTLQDSWSNTGTFLLSGGALSSAATIVLGGGILEGSGTVNAALTNQALVRPGGVGAAGLITVNGTYTQSAGGTLEVELGGATAGSGYDRLAVTGTATLAGTLSASLINAYAPTSGTLFDVLTRASGSGTFTEILPGAGWTVGYNATEVRLTAP